MVAIGDVRLEVDLCLGADIPGKGGADLQRRLGERETRDSVGSRAAAVAHFSWAVVGPAGSRPASGQAYIHEASQPETARLLEIVLSVRRPRQCAEQERTPAVARESSRHG